MVGGGSNSSTVPVMVRTCGASALLKLPALSVGSSVMVWLTTPPVLVLSVTLSAVDWPAARPENAPSEVSEKPLAAGRGEAAGQEVGRSLRRVHHPEIDRERPTVLCDGAEIERRDRAGGGQRAGVGRRHDRRRCVVVDVDVDRHRDGAQRGGAETVDAAAAGAAVGGERHHRVARHDSPDCVVEKFKVSAAVFDAPGAMSPVGPLPATVRFPVAPMSAAIRSSENPSLGALLATSSVSTPASPICA